MKKIIGLLLAVFFILPMTVKADMFKPSVYYNENVLIGGIYEVDIVFGPLSMPLNEYMITYDPEYLTIDESNVKLFYQGSNILTDSSVGTVKIANGKITIQVPDKPQEKVIEAVDWDLAVDSTNYYLELQFTALKSGTTRINTVESLQFFPLTVTASISDTNIETIPSDTEQKSDSKISNDEKTAGEKTESENNDLLLYCSLGFNALLFALLVIVLIKKKSPKTESKEVTPETPSNNE